MSRKDPTEESSSAVDPAPASAPQDQACPGEGCSGDPGEDAEPAVEASAEQLLEAARAEAAENYERFVRAKADIDNLLKRHQRELAERARYDGETLARDVLPAVDDLERALEHAGESSASVTGGIEMVLKGLLAALRRNGVERIEAAGKNFDPAEHEAVAMVENADVAPNTVMSVFRSGYRMNERLLRAAMVSVSKAPAAASADSGEAGPAGSD